MKTMLKVNNLSRKLGENLVVNSVNFSVEKNEIFGIVGPDGAGKSTLLRMIAGVLKPTSGCIFFDNVEYSKNPILIKEKISYMPQRFGLYEDLTVEENLHFIGRLFGIKKAEREIKIEKLYSFSGLKPYSKRLAGRLSGGMKQKLGLMCALMHNPILLVLDEPTNGVDPISRREFWDVLYDLVKEGASIVISTAYLDEAERCNKVGMLYNGSFLFSGVMEEIQKKVKEKLIELTVEDPIKTSKILSESLGYDIFVKGNSILLFAENEKEAMDRITSFLNKKLLSSSIKKPSLEDIFVKWIKETKNL